MKKFKINIVDIAAIALILAVGITIKMRFQKYNMMDDTQAQMSQIQYTMKFSNIRQFTADAFQIGDTVFDKQTGVEIGKIVAKEQQPNISLVGLIDGQIAKSEVPNKSDLILTIESDAIINDSGYYANKTIEIKVGSEKIIETLYAKSEGRILSLVKIQEE